MNKLPDQPSGTPWPTDSWPRGALPTSVDRVRLDRLLDKAFGAASSPTLGETHALVIVHRGRLVLERYAEGVGPEDTQPSWSKAKSITHALTGMLVGDGGLDIHAPAEVPEWRAKPDDPRAAITLDHLLRMSSGLRWVEDYVPGHVSDVIEMLYGSGKDDVAGYAAGVPLERAPGSWFYYSSGTTNIVSRLLAERLGAFGPDFEAFMRRRLFEPLGMASPVPKFDAAGTFIGSSFCFCTPRDFARFGLLYLRGGVWEGRRLLPEGWVDYARTPTFQQPEATDNPYGAHWWLDMAGPGSFSANGYDGQFIVCVPELDLVVVRHGRTPLELKAGPPAWIAEVVGCFR